MHSIRNRIKCYQFIKIKQSANVFENFLNLKPLDRVDGGEENQRQIIETYLRFRDFTPLKSSLIRLITSIIVSING